MGIVTIFQNHITVKDKVECKVIHCIFSLKEAVLEGILCQVVWRLRIVRVEGLNDCGILFLNGQLLLVETCLVVLVHVQKVGILIDVIRFTFFLNGALSSLLFVCNFPLYLSSGFEYLTFLALAILGGIYLYE